MRICITGCAGFIGSNLADRLIADGHEVWGIDNFATGRRENFNALLYEGRVEDGLPAGDEWESDLIIHCAASYKDPTAWDDDIETNVFGAACVGDRAKVWNARIFYFQTVLPPISSYAISKIAAEHYLRLSGQPLTVFRLAGIYGPRNLSGAIPTFYRQVRAGEPCTVVEDATRDYVYIDDLVERVVFAVENRENLMKPSTGETWEGSVVLDIRTGKETPIKNIPYFIGELLGVDPLVNLVPRREDDVPHYEMNGVPRIGVSFLEGLRRTVEWYEQNGVGETFTHLRLA